MSQKIDLSGFRYRADHFAPPASLLKKMLAAVLNKDDIDKVVGALGGLSVKDALNTVRITRARDSGKLSAEGAIVTRRSMLKESKGLSLVDPYMPAYLPDPQLEKFCKFEKEFFLNSHDSRLQPRGLLFDGPAGCVAEGTLIGIRRGRRNNHRLLPIEDLYVKFNNIGKPVSPWRKAMPSFTQSWHPETGRVVYNVIEGVYDKGERPCLEVTMANTGGVVLTHDHPILNDDGLFVRADILALGAKVLVRSSMLPQGEGRQVRPHRAVVEGLKYYPGGSYRSVCDVNTGKVYEYRRQCVSRLTVEAHLNGLTYEEFIHAIKKDPEMSSKLILLPKTVDVHHIDEDPTNDVLTNLQVLEKAAHHQLHNPNPEDRFKTDYTRIDTVVSVVDVGVPRTFDLGVGEQATNFVVNDGIIVHSCGLASF